MIHPPPVPSSVRPTPLLSFLVSSLRVGGSHPTALVREGCPLPKKGMVLWWEARGKREGARNKRGDEGRMRESKLLPLLQGAAQPSSGGGVLRPCQWEGKGQEGGGCSGSVMRVGAGTEGLAS